MLVGSRMTYPFVSATPRMTIAAAEELLKTENLYSVPVLDRDSRLLGMVTATELNDALARGDEDRFVEDIMDTNVLTVTQNTPIEEAARMIADYKVDTLPVLNDNFVVGVVTQDKLARILMEITGARQAGIRLTVELEDKPDRILPLMSAVYELNGNINTMSTYCSDDMEHKIIVMKVDNVDKFRLKQVVAPVVTRLVDIR